MLWTHQSIHASILKVLHVEITRTESHCQKIRNQWTDSPKRTTKFEESFGVHFLLIFILLVEVLLLAAILEEPDKPAESKSSLQAKQFYRSCTNVKKLEELGLQPLKDLLGKYGGWPVVKGDAWKASDYEWMRMSGRLLTTVGAKNILAFTSDSDFKNSSKRTFYVSALSLSA